MKKVVGAISGSLASLVVAADVALATHIPGHPVGESIKISIAPPAGSVNTLDIGNIPQFAIRLLFTIGILIAVIFLIYGGIKWILSGGDKTAVEAARNHIVAAIIGLVIVATAFFILSVVFQILGVNNPLGAGGFCFPTLADPNCKP